MKLQEAYRQIQHFASTEVAKHGFEADQVDTKRKPKHPHLIIGDKQSQNSSSHFPDASTVGPTQLHGSSSPTQLPISQAYIHPAHQPPEPPYHAGPITPGTNPRHFA